MSRFAFLASTGIALLAGLIFNTAAALSQDWKADVARQKAAVAANLKKAEFAKSAIVESDHFLIASTIPEEKAKLLGAVMDKVVPVARKALQFDGKDGAWKGKLAVYYLPESRDFRSFMRTVLVVQPEGVHFRIRSDDPFVVDPVDLPEKATESDQFANSAAIAAGAMLKARASGATLPEWLVTGFGRAAAYRAEGVNGKRYLAYRTAARGTASRGGKPTELWSETKPANAETLATSFADYLAFGPGAANFVKLVAGFRPDDTGAVPDSTAAFEAAGWKDLGMLETAWRKWAAK